MDGRFPELADAFASFGQSGTVFDGEIVRLKQDGISSFAALQEALSNEETGDLVYYAFDLLFLDGVDLRGLVLEKRKQLLAEVLANAPVNIRLSQHRVGGGKAFFTQACALKLEGIISKRRNSLYSGTRNPDWLKVKCLNTEEFVIIGYTEPQRSRVGFGALLVGYYTPSGELKYAGKVGTGYSREFLESVSGKAGADRAREADGGSAEGDLHAGAGALGQAALPGPSRIHGVDTGQHPAPSELPWPA